MNTASLRLDELIKGYQKLNIKYLKLNPLSMLATTEYNEILRKLTREGFDTILLNEEYGFELLHTPRLAWRRLRRNSQMLNTIIYGAGALWKLSVHPLKGILSPYPSDTYKVDDLTMLLTETGEIDRSGLVFKGFNKLVSEAFNVEHVAFTHHLYRVRPINSNNNELLIYLVALLNSFIGKYIANIAWYGALQPELDRKAVEQIPIPVAPAQLRNNVVELLSSAYASEIKAWRAYFKAMKIVEEYLKPTLVKATGASRLLIAKNAGRLDGAGLLAFGLLEEIAKRFGKSIKLYNVFEIKSGNVPRSKDYKGVSGIPYITIDSIDDSGIVDEEKMAFIPREKYKRSFTKTKNHDILLVKDGIGSLGKVAVTLGEYPVMSGIFILRGKAIEDELLYYIVTILKTRFYRKIMEMMSYGTTGQISLTKRDVENLLIPILDNYKEIGVLFKEFVENMYQANALKRQAIAELENYILGIVG